MVCYIENCKLTKPGEKGKNFAFGYLCESHFDLLDNFFSLLPEGSDLSVTGQRKLWVKFKMEQESLSGRDAK